MKISNITNTNAAQSVSVKPVNTPEAVPASAPEVAVEKTITITETAQNKNTGSMEADQNKNEQIRKAVEKLNKNMAHSDAVFGIHEATNRVTIKIVDRDTKEVIKELPPEKTLDMIAKVWEMAGILVDEKR